MGKGASDGGGKSKSNSFTSKELRDLFSVQLQTTCHTHELLGCNCLNEDDHEDEEDGSTNGDASGAEDEDEDEDDRPAGFQSASLIRPETTAKVDKALAKKRKAQLASLEELTHIECLNPVARERILDDVLRAIVLSQGEEDEGDVCDGLDFDTVPCGSVTFAFEKTSAMARKEEDEKRDKSDDDVDE